MPSEATKYRKSSRHLCLTIALKKQIPDRVNETSHPVDINSAEGEGRQKLQRQATCIILM